MATKGEKIFGAVAGAAAAGYLGYLYANKRNIPKEDQWKYVIGGMLAGAAAGYALACVLGSTNDTVNYRLLKNGRLVYHGITYSHRATQREREHIKTGKRFDRMIISECIPRCEATELERTLIKRDKPAYNIIYNC